MLSFLKDVAKPQTAAVIFGNTLLGQSQGKSFAAACEGLGCKVVMKEGFESGSVDFKPLIMKLKSANPDLVYAICYDMDAGLIVRQSKELNFCPKLFVGGGGRFALPKFVKKRRGLLLNTSILRPYGKKACRSQARRSTTKSTYSASRNPLSLWPLKRMWPCS